jgi:hypothetical protein
MTESLQSIIHSLAARSALLTLSAHRDPVIIERITEFAQDKGAVGLLLDLYEDNRTIEEVALWFWNSRIEKTGSRFEDIIATTILSIFSSLIAGILVEAWKGELGASGRLLSNEERDRLRIASRREPQLKRDLSNLLPFYYAKLDEQGVSSSAIAQDLYNAITDGRSFAQFSDRFPHSIIHKDYDLLKFAQEVARGVVRTEILRAGDMNAPKYVLDRNGVQFSPGFAFGETIYVKKISEFRTDQFNEKLSTSRLYPELWPAECRVVGPSPKILVLKQRDISGDAIEFAGRAIAGCAGVISPVVGCTSHIAVTCRTLGTVGTGCKLSEEERATSKFALLQDRKLKLYFDRPSFSASDFEVLVMETRRLNSKAA